MIRSVFFFLFFVCHLEIVLGQKIEEPLISRSKTVSFVDSAALNEKRSASMLRQDSARHIRKEFEKKSEKAQNLIQNKATSLEYDSENPGNAPWKKEQFSKDDLKQLGVPDKMPEAKDINSKEYLDKLKNATQADEKKLKDDAFKKTGDEENVKKAKETAEKVKSLEKTPLNEEQVRNEVTKAAKSSKFDKAITKTDSLMDVGERIQANGLEQELMSAQRVYSEKYIKKLYDSLGLTKADSMFKVVNAFAKTETPRSELIQRLNEPLQQKSGLKGVSFDEKSEALKMDDAEKLEGVPDQAKTLKDGELSKLNLSSLQLPQDVLSELEPLRGKLIDSKYMPVIDSMREVAMKAKGYKLNEQQVTEEVKQAAFKKKPRFIDKSYIEGILTFVNDSTLSLVQVSPAWAYHFTPRISAGLGPNVSVQYQKRLIGVVGFRAFVKSEFYHQRLYVQLEDNFSPIKFENEAMKSKTNHNLLLGGGALLPLSKKIAINFAAFYRVNQGQVRPGGSPFVFRIGLSSVKNVSKR